MLQKKAVPPEKFSSDEFRLDPNLVWYLRPFFQFLYYHYFRVKTVGISNIPCSESGIIVANHAGVLPYDGVMLNLAVSNNHKQHRPVRFLVHDFAFQLPLLGSLVERLGGVRASPENALRLLNKNRLILVFPEGVKGIGKLYDGRYNLKKFGRGGFIRTAIMAKAPIIPTAIIGSEEIHPALWNSKYLGEKIGVPYIPITPTFPWLGPLGLIPLPTKWKMIFGKPIRLNKYNLKDTKNDDLMLTLAENIKQKIQKMINKELSKRSSIWR